MYRNRRQNGSHRRSHDYHRHGGGGSRHRYHHRRRGRYESDDDEKEYDAIETRLMFCNSGIPDMGISSATTRCLNGPIPSDIDRVDEDDHDIRRGSTDDDAVVSVTPSMLAERDFRWTMPLETFQQGMQEVHNDIVGLGQDTYRLMKQYYDARDEHGAEAGWCNCGEVASS